MYRDQRVDFSLETPQGLGLVIEIDGGQHGSDAAQAHLDKQRDSELKRVGWAVWRIPTSALDDTARVGQEGLALIESLGYAAPQGARDAAATSIDRKSVVQGKRVAGRVDLGGRRYIKKKKTDHTTVKYANT